MYMIGQHTINILDRSRTDQGTITAHAFLLFGFYYISIFVLIFYTSYSFFLPSAWYLTFLSLLLHNLAQDRIEVLVSHVEVDVEAGRT